MATHKEYRGLDAGELDSRIRSLEELARITRNLRDRLDESVTMLELEHREALAAYKLATLAMPRVSWRVPVRLGITKDELSYGDLGAALGVSTVTVRKMILDGRLPPPSKQRRRCVFYRSEIDAWIAKQSD